MTVLAVAEHRDGELRDVTHDVIAASRKIGAARDLDVHLSIIGSNAESLAADLEDEPIETIHYTDFSGDFNHDVYSHVIDGLAADVGASVVITPHSVNGLDYVPALADRLDATLVTDIVDVSAGDELIVTREMYSSKVETTLSITPPVVLSVRPGEWDEVTAGGTATIQEFDPGIDTSQLKSEVVGYEEVAAGDIDISDADVLVSVGRGIDEEDNLELIEELADEIDGTVSASRPIIDNGWLPKNRQVGQSGKTVTPAVYIAIGISGAVQHVSGMKGAERIVAINTDPNAPIFDVADYGIVDDLFDVVPELIEELE